MDKLRSYKTMYILFMTGDSLQPTVECGTLVSARLEEGVEGSGGHVPGSRDNVQQSLQQHGARDVGCKGTCTSLLFFHDW